MINGYTINGAAAHDEEDYQLWLRDPASPIAHLVEVDYHGDSATYENWNHYTLKSADRADLAFTGYPDRVLSVGNFTRQIGEKFTGYVNASIGSIDFDNSGGLLDSWHRLSIDGQRVRVLHGHPSWARERYRIVYECIAEKFASSTVDTLTLDLRGLEYKANKPIQMNVVSTVDTQTNQNQVIPLAYGDVFNATPVLLDGVNLVYQVNDGAITSMSDARDGGIRFRTEQIAISSVTGSVMSTAAAHGFYADTRVRCDLGTLPNVTTWTNMAWNGTVYCAVAIGTTIAATSPDGITWTQRVLPVSALWSSIVWNGTVFCIVASGGVTTAATSPDGITWTTRTLPVAANWYAIAWNGAVLCAVAYNSTIAATSPDGITWTQRVLPTTANWRAISWNGTSFCTIALGSAIAATSPDGITWTQQALPVSAGWYSIAWNGTVFCTVAANSSIAATSPDGITWTQRVLSASAIWREIAWNGVVFCVVSTTSSTTATTSPDGITWTTRTLPAAADWYAITWNGEVFCAIAVSSTYATTSPDGITWSSVTNTLPTPLATNTDYWVTSDGLTSTAFKLSATRGGSPVTLTSTTAGAAIIGYHWTADTATGKLYLDSNHTGVLTCDFVAGADDASDIVISILEATNVDSQSRSYFDATADKAIGVYIAERRNRLDVADEAMSGIGSWYGRSREGMLRFGRVEGNPATHDFALIEADMWPDTLHVAQLIPPAKQHRIGYRRNYTNQSGALFTGVSADNQVLFSNDYSITQPILGTDEGANGGFHTLAIVPDFIPSQMALSSDAADEAARLDAMYFGWGAIFACTTGRIGTAIDIGQVVKITHSRYELSGGVNMTCVDITDNPSLDKVELKFFVALANYTPGQL